MIVDIYNPNQKYSVIYADPPWTYRNGGNGAAKNHYATMTAEQIKNLPVAHLAKDNAVLFMWSTFPNLKHALETIEAWGFEYKTLAFNWVKRNKSGNGWFWGLGFWTRANSEICLLAVKGKPKRISARVHSVVDAPIARHSAKPAEVRERIVELMGDVPRIELFARNTVPGWDAWGNEVYGV